MNRYVGDFTLVQAGGDLPTIRRISGIKTLSMVFSYVHANVNHIRVTMDELESRYRPPEATEKHRAELLSVTKY